MQQLQSTTLRRCSAERCAAEILEAAPAVIRFIRAQMRAQRGAELSVPQFRALAYLGRNRRAALAPLADFLGLTPPAASRLVNGLVKQRLVSRRIQQDNRRQLALSLSDRGEALWRASRREARRRLAQIVRPLGDDQREVIFQAMSLLREVFQTEPAEPNP